MQVQFPQGLYNLDSNTILRKAKAFVNTLALNRIDDREMKRYRSSEPTFLLTTEKYLTLGFFLFILIEHNFIYI